MDTDYIGAILKKCDSFNRTYFYLPRSVWLYIKWRCYWRSKTNLVFPKKCCVLMCLPPWHWPQELRKAPLQDLPQVLKNHVGVNKIGLLNVSGYIYIYVLQIWMTNPPGSFFSSIKNWAKSGRIIHNHMSPVQLWWGLESIEKPEMSNGFGVLWGLYIEDNFGGFEICHFVDHNVSYLVSLKGFILYTYKYSFTWQSRPMMVSGVIGVSRLVEDLCPCIVCCPPQNRRQETKV